MNLMSKNKTLNFLEQNQRFQNQEVSDMIPQYNETFDFIVISAGTAGAAIAARLSEISEVKILLIEAGFHESFFMDIPTHQSYLWTVTSIGSTKLGLPTNTVLV